MPISLSGSLNLSGSLTTTGTITATTLVVQTITSSISSITGSTNFGSLVTDTHKFTGSLNVTGSLTVVTTGTEFQVNPSGVNLGNALTDSHVISGSLRVNPNGLFVSSSGNVGIGLTTPKESLEVAGLYGNIRIYGRTGVSNNAITSNMYYDGTNWVRDNGSYGAAQIVLSAQLGSIIFGTTGSAVGDATERMRITSAGIVQIKVPSAADQGILFKDTADISRAKVYYDDISGQMTIGTMTGYSTVFVTNNTERMRVANGGYLEMRPLTFSGVANNAIQTVFSSMSKGTWLVSVANDVDSTDGYVAMLWVRTNQIIEMQVFRVDSMAFSYTNQDLKIQNLSGFTATLYVTAIRMAAS